MLKVNVEKWQQTPEDLRKQVLQASHLRTRERLLALYAITQGLCATQVASHTQRNPQTLMEWVHRYHTAGPNMWMFRRSPLCLHPLNKA